MKRNHYLILGGVALLAGYLWYKNDKDKKNRKLSLSKISPSMTEGEASNFQGSSCTCDNGFTGWCRSGDCSKCCASYNDKKRPTETRRYKF